MKNRERNNNQNLEGPDCFMGSIKIKAKTKTKVQ